MTYLTTLIQVFHAWTKNVSSYILYFINRSVDRYIIYLSVMSFLFVQETVILPIQQKDIFQNSSLLSAPKGKTDISYVQHNESF